MDAHGLQARSIGRSRTTAYKLWKETSAHRGGWEKQVVEDPDAQIEAYIVARPCLVRHKKVITHRLHRAACRPIQEERVGARQPLF